MRDSEREWSGGVIFLTCVMPMVFGFCARRCGIACHDTNSELYIVDFSRDRMTVTSYSADAILTKVETWADSVPTLA